MTTEITDICAIKKHVGDKDCTTWQDLCDEQKEKCIKCNGILEYAKNIPCQGFFMQQYIRAGKHIKIK